MNSFDIRSSDGVKSIPGWFAMLTGAILISTMLALCIGQYSLSPGECIRILVSRISPPEEVTWNPVSEKVIFYLRLPRIIASALVGASLAIAGATFQGVFQNPLVSSDLLGVSSGSCVGAAVAILAGLGAAGIQTFAFVFGIVTVLLTLMIPKLLKNDSNIMLVLSGIIVGGLMGSVMGFIKYVADPESELAAITYWQMGSFEYITYGDIISILPVIIFGMAGVLLLAWQIDLLSLGETEARILGVNVPLVRNFTVICATLLTAGSVCLSGTIGWVGLVIPHFARSFVGPNNRILLPTSAMFGAVFLIIVDTAARSISSTELPISVITGIIGAPFYVFLLYRQKTRLQTS